MLSPIVLYDADCGVCRWMLARILTWDRDAKVRVAAIQSPEGEELLAPVPHEKWLKSWHLVDATGQVHSAGAAIPVLFADLPGGFVLGPAARLAEAPLSWGYRAFASNRSFFGKFVTDDAKRRAQVKIDARTFSSGA